MKKILILSHCLLNNLCENPPAPEIIKDKIYKEISADNISVLQLPCPELCYQALNRDSIYPGTEAAEDYEAYCKKLIDPIVHNLEEYKKHNIEISAVYGIDTSPSCSVIDKTSIMMKYLLTEMERLEIKCEILADITSEGELIRR